MATAGPVMRAGRSSPVARECAKVERDPHQCAHDRERQQQMRRKPEMADVRPVDEAGHDHVPAERALQPAEDEQAASFQP